jgi:hypothetical protein
MDEKGAPSADVMIRDYRGNALAKAHSFARRMADNKDHEGEALWRAIATAIQKKWSSAD